MKNLPELFTFQKSLETKKITEEIQSCNEYTCGYGLTLSEDEISRLIHCKDKALKDTGRIEFSDTVIPKLIHAFCDSPYINQKDYESILSQLIEAFYYYKNEYNDCYTDDELIELMVQVFNARGGELI